MTARNPQPALSIIIAQYNNGKYFKELYDSIKSQDRNDFEVIVTDDKSSDDTFEIMQKIAGKDSQFTIIRHSVNMGAGAAFKTCMQKVNSAIVLMVGADDALCKNAVSTIINGHVLYPNSSLINFSYFICDETLKVIEPFIYKVPYQKDYFYWETRGADTFKVESYKLTQGFDENLRRAVDVDICFKLEEVGEPIYIDSPVFFYRKNPIGISQNLNRWKAKILYYRLAINTYERRKQLQGTKNISTERLRSIKAEVNYYIALDYALRRKNLYFMLLHFYAFLIRIMHRTQVSVSTNKEVNYAYRNFIKSTAVFKIFKP